MADEYPDQITTPALLSLYGLTLLGQFGGWLIIWNHGFASKLGKRSPVIQVDMPLAGIMAAIMFTMGTIGVLAIARAHGATRTMQIAIVALTLMLPLVKLLWF